jgi:hypothetical protein
MEKNRERGRGILPPACEYAGLMSRIRKATTRASGAADRAREPSVNPDVIQIDRAHPRRVRAALKQVMTYDEVVIREHEMACTAPLSVELQELDQSVDQGSRCGQPGQWGGASLIVGGRPLRIQRTKASCLK